MKTNGERARGAMFVVAVIVGLFAAAWIDKRSTLRSERALQFELKLEDVAIAVWKEGDKDWLRIAMAEVRATAISVQQSQPDMTAGYLCGDIGREVRFMACSVARHLAKPYSSWDDDNFARRVREVVSAHQAEEEGKARVAHMEQIVSERGRRQGQ